jgi:hypothetical protein
MLRATGARCSVGLACASCRNAGCCAQQAAGCELQRRRGRAVRLSTVRVLQRFAADDLDLSEVREDIELLMVWLLCLLCVQLGFVCALPWGCSAVYACA